MGRFAGGGAALGLAGLAGLACGSPGPETAPGGSESLAEARSAFRSALAPEPWAGEPVERPPAGVLDLVRYPAPGGELAAYRTPPSRGPRRPAIVWITGGDCNSLGDVWSPAPPEDDQSAAAFRDAGIVTMYPALRGGNGGGSREWFLGEVDDVLAAADFLAGAPDVDPARIYLGGHSTGGTMALLAAESSGRFRAVFAFGPVGAIDAYGPEVFPAAGRDARESAIRSPEHWLADVTSPTFLLEGSRGPVTNWPEVLRLARLTANPQVHAVEIPGRDHFDGLQPVSRMLAAKILADTGPVSTLAVTDADVREALGP